MRRLLDPVVLRRLLTAVNLALFALLAWYAILAFDLRGSLDAPSRSPGASLPDPGWYAGRGYRAAAPRGPDPRAIADRLDPPPPALFPSPVGNAPSPGGGPLRDAWTLESVLVGPGRAQVFALLSRRRPEAPPAAGHASTPRRNVPGGAFAPPALRRWEATAVPGREDAQILVPVGEGAASRRPVMIGERAYYFIGIQERPLGVIYVEAASGRRPDPASTRHVLRKEEEEDGGDPLELIGKLRA